MKKNNAWKREAAGITVSGVGFVCTGGFAFEGAEGFTLIDGKALYFNE